MFAKDRHFVGSSFNLWSVLSIPNLNVCTLKWFSQIDFLNFSGLVKGQNGVFYKTASIQQYDITKIIFPTDLGR